MKTASSLFCSKICEGVRYASIRAGKPRAASFAGARTTRCLRILHLNTHILQSLIADRFSSKRKAARSLGSVKLCARIYVRDKRLLFCSLAYLLSNTPFKNSYCIVGWP